MLLKIKKIMLGMYLLAAVITQIQAQVQAQAAFEIEKIKYSGKKCPISKGVKLYPSLSESSQFDLLANGLYTAANEGQIIDANECTIFLILRVEPNTQIALKNAKAAFKTEVVGRGHSLATFEMSMSDNQFSWPLLSLNQRTNGTNQGTKIDILLLEKKFLAEEMKWLPACGRESFVKIEATLKVYSKVGFQGMGSAEIATLPIIENFLDISERSCPSSNVR